METEKNSVPVTGEMLAEKARQVLKEGWGYIWGTRGQIWTAAAQRAATRAQTVKYGSQWIGKRVCDCSGLVVWAAEELGLKGLHHGSNSQYSDDCIRKGALKNGLRADGKELKTGSLVFVTENGSRHHVGIYTGGGTVIEARGTASGVIQSDTGVFDEWGELKGVDFTAPECPETWASVQKDSRGIAVLEMQQLLTAAGFNCGTPDGICGKKTLAALTAFQQSRGLDPDGICGEKTWQALQESAAEQDRPESENADENGENAGQENEMTENQPNAQAALQMPEEKENAQKKSTQDAPANGDEESGATLPREVDPDIGETGETSPDPVPGQNAPKMPNERENTQDGPGAALPCVSGLLAVLLGRLFRMLSRLTRKILRKGGTPT